MGRPRRSRSKMLTTAVARSTLSSQLSRGMLVLRTLVGVRVAFHNDLQVGLLGNHRRQPLQGFAPAWIHAGTSAGEQQFGLHADVDLAVALLHIQAFALETKQRLGETGTQGFGRTFARFEQRFQFLHTLASGLEQGRLLIQIFFQSVQAGPHAPAIPPGFS